MIIRHLQWVVTVFLGHHGSRAPTDCGVRSYGNAVVSIRTDPFDDRVAYVHAHAADDQQVRMLRENRLFSAIRSRRFKL